MEFPHIHSCIKLSAENEELKHKLHSVRKAWSILDKEVRAYREREKIDSVLKDYATSRDVYVQTDPVKSLLSSNLGASKKKQELQSNAASSDMEKNNKFLSMHSQLLKRYERELQSNMTHLENINSLNLKINALEQRSQKEKSRCTELERQLYELRQKAKQRGHSRAVPENSPIATKMEHDRLKHALRKCDKLERQNAKFKTELRDLDDGFFEEVEDLKFALQQSARLNQEYEKTLKKMCSQFGMPYPDQLLDITGQG